MITAIRERVAVSWRPKATWRRMRGEAGWDALDRAVPTDLFIGVGQVRQALALRDDGTVAADVLVGADGDDLVVRTEGDPVPLPGSEPLDDHVAIGIDGPFAWELLARWDTPSVIGLGYLQLYRPRPDILCFRAGQTGEYGYELLLPRDRADAVHAELLELGRELDVAEADETALSYCALENWFLAIPGYTPSELQLQWRVSRRKVELPRSERRITAITGASLGSDVSLDGRVIGEVIRAEPAHGRDGFIGAALIDRPYAHSGVDAYTSGGAPIRTVSPPFAINRSLFVKGQAHTWAGRDRIPVPPGLEWTTTPS